MVLSLVKSKPPHRPPPNTSGSTSTTTDRADNTTPNCSEYQSETASSETQTETPVNVQRCALRHGGLDRVFYMYIPTSYTSSSDNQPLLFSLHGYTSSALTNLSYTGFESPANANGFIVIYPRDRFYNQLERLTGTLGAGLPVQLTT